jgi:hypothetical protein
LVVGDWLLVVGCWWVVAGRVRPGDLILEKTKEFEWLLVVSFWLLAFGRSENNKVLSVKNNEEQPGGRWRAGW